MYAVQQALASSAFTDVMGVPAWKSLPSWYLVAPADEVKSLLADYLPYGAGRNPEVCASEKKHPVHVIWLRENHDA